MHPFSFIQSRLHISRLGRAVFAGLVFALIFLGLLQFSRPVSFAFGIGSSSSTLQWVDDGPESVEGTDGKISLRDSLEVNADGNGNVKGHLEMKLYSVKQNPTSKPFYIPKTPPSQS